MVKGNKSIKPTIKKDKDVMLLDNSNCAALVRVNEDNELHSDYKFKFPKDSEHLDFNELRLSADSDKLYTKRSVYSMEFVNWFVKICKVFYNTNKITVEDLIYCESKTKDYPLLIIYNNIGAIIAPRVEND